MMTELTKYLVSLEQKGEQPLPSQIILTAPIGLAHHTVQVLVQLAIWDLKHGLGQYTIEEYKERYNESKHPFTYFDLVSAFSIRQPHAMQIQNPRLTIEFTKIQTLTLDAHVEGALSLYADLNSNPMQKLFEFLMLVRADISDFKYHTISNLTISLLVGFLIKKLENGLHIYSPKLLPEFQQYLVSYYKFDNLPDFEKLGQASADNEYRQCFIDNVLTGDEWENVVAKEPDLNKRNQLLENLWQGFKKTEAFAEIKEAKFGLFIFPVRDYTATALKDYL